MDVIGDLLPSALAVALSPVPIIAVVLALGAPNARTAGPSFALGWITGLVAVRRHRGCDRGERQRSRPGCTTVVLLLLGAKLLGDGLAIL
jgi:hypothetical protein